MSDDKTPNFYIHNFDSPQPYNMPLGNGVNGWQLESLSSDAVKVVGLDGVPGFYTSFWIFWVHDGEALAKFKGYEIPGGEEMATYELQIFATSGARGVKLLKK